jgi:hypothetical protein
MTDDSEETEFSTCDGRTGSCRETGLRRCLVSGMALLTERCREVGGCEQTLPGKGSKHSLLHVALRRCDKILFETLSVLELELYNNESLRNRDSVVLLFE